MFESAFNMTRTPRPHSCISRCSNVTSMECLGNTPRPGPGRHRTPASAAGALSQFWLKPVRQRRRLTASLRAGVVEHYTARMSSRRVAATAGTGTVDCGNSEGRRGATAAAGTKVLGRLEPVGLPPARLADGTEAPYLSTKPAAHFCGSLRTSGASHPRPSPERQRDVALSFARDLVRA